LFVFTADDDELERAEKGKDGFDSFNDRRRLLRNVFG
jgi:hypothetical protein